MKRFDRESDLLRNQYKKISWIKESGKSPEEITALFHSLMQSGEKCSRAVLRARAFALILSESRLAVDEADIFQEKVWGGNLILRQREAWEREMTAANLAEEDLERKAARDAGAFSAGSDFGHTSPNSQRLLELGIGGLIDRVNRLAAREGMTDEQLDFYESCRIVLSAISSFALRLADATEPHDRESAEVLRSISLSAPKTLREAMQLLILYFFLHEYTYGTRVRTLGRLDVLLSPFYRRDLAEGRLTEDEARELLNFFLFKFYVADVPFGLPFAIGGMDADGSEVTDEFTHLIVDTFDSLSIHSPKIHVRVSKKTPASLIRRVLSAIRGGNSSFVFVNDATTVRALEQVGIETKDARNYVPIGCYEPAVWGVEIGCTGNGGVSLPKALELVMTRGKDLRSGRQLGLDTGIPQSFDDLLDAVKRQIAHLTEKVIDYVVKIEKYYGEIGPDPLLSCMYDACVERGVDALVGGAKYNNSSLYFYCIASLVDAHAAIRRIVYDKGLLSYSNLVELLKNDWAGEDRLRTLAKNLPEKYGNGNPFADELTVDIARFTASLVNRRPNGRGGVFKAALFSIDYCFTLGEKTMATPDGRHAGDPLSKNLCASSAMDRNGITALISSVTKIDHADFPNGSVLDVVLHPSAVKGEDGLTAMQSILSTYFARGGFALHGNVFDASTLRDAQKNPDAYRNLQVRLCGWNTYFVSLSEAEQNAFIAQAENAV